MAAATAKPSPGSAEYDTQATGETTQASLGYFSAERIMLHVGIIIAIVAGIASVLLR